MSPTTARLLLLSTLAALGTATPRASHALEASASAGFGYFRQTLEPDLGPKVVLPSFSLDLRLDARGYFERRGLLDWKIGAGYRQFTADSFSSNVGKRSYVDYLATIAFNGEGRGPLGLRLSAMRNEQRYGTQLVGSTVFGESDTTTVAVNTSLRLPAMQSLTLGYDHSTSSDRVPGLATHESTSQNLTAGLHMPLHGGDLSARYAGHFGSGLWISDQSQFHSGTVIAQARLADRLHFGLSESFSVQLPSTTAVGQYRAEQNDFSASMGNSRIGGASVGFQYGASRALIAPNGGSFAEATRQFLHGSSDFLIFGTMPSEGAGAPLTEGHRLYLQASADGSYGRTRTPLSKASAWGETLGTVAYYTSQTASKLFQLHLGPYFGWTQVDQGPDTFGWGLSTGALFSRPLDVYMVSLEYNLDYTDHLYASDSTSLAQNVQAAISGPVASFRCSASLRASVQKQHSGAFGDGASRYLALNLAAARHPVSVTAAALVSDGILPGVAQRTFIGDGLFIPAPYDTQSRDLSAGLTWAVAPALNAYGTVRRTAIVVPGQPSINQSTALGGAYYAFAGFSAGLSYEANWYDAGGGGMYSVLMFRISRGIGINTW